MLNAAPNLTHVAVDVKYKRGYGAEARLKKMFEFLLLGNIQRLVTYCKVATDNVEVKQIIGISSKGVLHFSLYSW